MCALRHTGARSSLAATTRSMQPLRTIERAIAASKVGVQPGKPGPRPSTLATKFLRRPAGIGNLCYRSAARPKLLLEVCAYPRSALSHAWPRHGQAAVRIVFLQRSGSAQAGPVPVPGRAMDWPLNLHRVRDRRHLRAYAAQHKPQHLWTSPDCSAFTPVQRINHARLGEHWRPLGEKKALDIIGYCRLLHRGQHA